LLPTALSPVPTSSAPVGSKRSRHPPCLPEDSFTGISPSSGSATLVADRHCSSTVQLMTSMDGPPSAAPSSTPWQV
jgi:hypothetical protein